LEGPKATVFLIYQQNHHACSLKLACLAHSKDVSRNELYKSTLLTNSFTYLLTFVHYLKTKDWPIALSLHSLNLKIILV